MDTERASEQRSRRAGDADGQDAEGGAAGGHGRLAIGGVGSESVLGKLSLACIRACSAECPREAQVGEVEIESPDLPEILKGEVYLASPQCSHMPRAGTLHA